jgi:predicted RNA methylase
VSSTRASLQNPDSLDGGLGAFSLPFHREMVSDGKRVGVFRRAIERAARNKVVIDCCTGTGIMSILAAKAGARHVFAVEVDPRIAEHAQANFEACGLTKKITLIRKSIVDVRARDLKHQLADLVVAENLSTWLVTEPQIVNMNQMFEHRLVRPGAIFVPAAIRNELALARAQFRFQGVVNIKTYYFEFTGIRCPKMMSRKHEFGRIDFSVWNPTSQSIVKQVTPILSGTVNAVRLTSRLFVGDGLTFDHSDTLLPPVVFPLDADLKVKAGRAIEVAIDHETSHPWEEFHVCLTHPGRS